MNREELAFFNLQLAAMLRSGLPLEGSLRQLAATMRNGRLRAEAEKLEADLSQGRPLAEAILDRQLPELYRRMVGAGARGQNLPEILILAADYYKTSGLLLTRLKGLMLYPVLVLLMVVAFSLVAGKIGHTLNEEISVLSRQARGVVRYREPPPPMSSASLIVNAWAPAVVTGGLALAAVLATGVAPIRRSLTWRIPVLRELQLAHLCVTIHALLRSGCGLAETLELAENLESGSPAARDLRQWRERLAAGHASWTAMTEGSRMFPPYFLWLVASAGENLVSGFERAAQHYQSRAGYHQELLLYAALPVSMVLLGFLVLGQLFRILGFIKSLYGTMFW